MTADLRSYLSSLGKDLLRVTRPVDLENISAMINLAKQPVLFSNIVEHSDWSICDLLFLNRKSQAHVLNTTPENVLSKLGRILQSEPRAPVRVQSAPVKECIYKGEAVDLLSIPAFQHGEKDMGRVIIAMTVSADPESGRSNLAWTRMTPLDQKRATYFIGSSPHMRSILTKHEEKNIRMPMAFVIGTHPAYEIMGSYSVPTHLEKFGELDMVGALLDEDVQVVPCETIPLMVPAHAEVVIEGYVIPNVRIDEGPGPSQALYYVPGASKQPVFEVTAITRRQTPVLRQINTLLYTDHQPLISLPHEAILFERLREMGAKVHDVSYVPWGGTLTCVVKMTPEYDGQVKDLLLFVLGNRWPNAKLAIAIDDDIDIESPEDLHWCLATRVDPGTDLSVIQNTRGHPIDPMGQMVEGVPRARLVSKWLIDATKPPLGRPKDRARFERTLPKNWGSVRLPEG